MDEPWTWPSTLVSDPYPAVRALLGEPWRDAPAEDVEDTLAEVLGDVDPGKVEAVMESLGQVGAVFGKALPGVLSGAMAGAPLGPVGALAGAALGGVGAGMGAAATSRSTRRRKPVPRPTPSAPSPAAALQRPAAPPARRARSAVSAQPHRDEPPGAGAGAGSPSAARLLTLLFRPEVLQAVAAMALGSAGRDTIVVGDTPVPLGAFTNVIGTLASQAGNELALPPGEAEDIPVYLLGRDGSFRGDPTLPESRAEVLLGLLAETEPPSPWTVHWDEPEWPDGSGADGWDDGWDEGWFDE